MPTNPSSRKNVTRLDGVDRGRSSNFAQQVQGRKPRQYKARQTLFSDSCRMCPLEGSETDFARFISFWKACNGPACSPPPATDYYHSIHLLLCRLLAVTSCAPAIDFTVTKFKATRFMHDLAPAGAAILARNLIRVPLGNPLFRQLDRRPSVDG